MMAVLAIVRRHHPPGVGCAYYGSSMAEKVQERPVFFVASDKLLLDPDNPRLPEEVQGGTQASLLAYLESHDALHELAASFVANGFFQNEPLVVLPEREDGTRVVVEGNRRLSTLLILLQEPAALESELAFDLDPAPSSERLDQLRSVPVFEISDASELNAYLGFRHISGIRRWGAEPKARFIARAVDEMAANDSRAPFYDVGRLVGSNAGGVRSSYIALKVLRLARQETDINVRPIMSQRFGVWMRLLGTANVPTYLGLDKGAREHAEVLRSVASVRIPELQAVVQDLLPTADSAPILSDSRDATTYSDIVADERALTVLREHRDLALAAQLVQGVAFSRRVERIRRSIEIARGEVREEQIDETMLLAADEVLEAAESLVSTIRRAHRRQANEGADDLGRD